MACLGLFVFGFCFCVACCVLVSVCTLGLFLLGFGRSPAWAGSLWFCLAFSGPAFFLASLLGLHWLRLAGPMLPSILWSSPRPPPPADHDRQTCGHFCPVADLRDLHSRMRNDLWGGSIEVCPLGSKKLAPGVLRSWPGVLRSWSVCRFGSFCGVKRAFVNFLEAGGWVLRGSG